MCVCVCGGGGEGGCSKTGKVGKGNDDHIHHIYLFKDGYIGGEIDESIGWGFVPRNGPQKEEKTAQWVEQPTRSLCEGGQGSPPGSLPGPSPTCSAHIGSGSAADLSPVLHR